MAGCLRAGLTPAGQTPQTTHQVLKLHIQVLLDGEARVRDGFIEVRVQVCQHLGRWVTNGTDVSSLSGASAEGHVSRLEDCVRQGHIVIQQQSSGP